MLESKNRAWVKTEQLEPKEKLVSCDGEKRDGERARIKRKKGIRSVDYSRYRGMKRDRVSEREREGKRKQR